MAKFKKGDRVVAVYGTSQHGTVQALKGDGLFAVAMDGRDTPLWYYKSELALEEGGADNG